MDRKFFSLLLALGLVLAGMPSAQAEDDDHELAQRALREGRALPLAEILAKVTIEIPGKLIDAELESEDGVLVYDLKMLTQEGRLQEIEVDAATGNILKVEDDD